MLCCVGVVCMSRLIRRKCSTDGIVSSVGGCTVRASVVRTVSFPLASNALTFLLLLLPPLPLLLPLLLLPLCCCWSVCFVLFLSSITTQVSIQLMDWDPVGANDYAGCLFLDLGACRVEPDQDSIPHPGLPTWMPFSLEKPGDSSGELLVSYQVKEKSVTF